MKGKFITLDGIVNAEIEYRSDYAMEGCEGVVIPVTVTTETEELPLQSKWFFTDSFDDKARDFAQDPVAKVHESYNTLVLLREKGFRIVPFFGKFIFEEQPPMLLMTDLEQYGRVIDEKLYRRRGEEQTIKNSTNASETLQKYAKNHLLAKIYGIGLGNGTAHMFVHDEAKNTTDVFISDVGEVRQVTRPYTNTLAAGLIVPHDEIQMYYQELSDEPFPGFDEYKDLSFQCAITGWLKKELPTTSAQNIQEYADILFTKGDAHDRQYKLNLLYREAQRQEQFGLETIDISGHSNDPLNQAYVLALDKRVRWLKDARCAVDLNEKLPDMNDYEPGLVFFSEKVPEKVSRIYYQRPIGMQQFIGNKELALDINVPWSEAIKGDKDIENIVEPTDITRVYHRTLDNNLKWVDHDIFEEFSSEKVQLHTFKNDGNNLYRAVYKYENHFIFYIP